MSVFIHQIKGCADSMCRIALQSQGSHIIGIRVHDANHHIVEEHFERGMLYDENYDAEVFILDASAVFVHVCLHCC